ncbi:unnamed protein product [Allacma fusca]|uniref:C2H2-type domain-containing protein n=1 Tax=Allacma fusca TaxID=39272 RepID=A0A8J2KWT7_9HEXA|nr:unnamed protein product [Allacma fusca]
MSSSEMDNLDLGNGTFLLHHEPDLELTTGEFFSSINNDTSQCLFCSNVIAGTPIINLNSQAPCQSSLDDFARLFKISRKTLFQGTNNYYESVLTNLPCVTCAVSIDDAVKLLDEIERLQAGLDAILNRLKSNLFNSYESRVTSGVLNEGKEKDVEIFQKTFIQCWSDCKVEVTPLGKQRQGIRRGKPNKSSFKRETFTDGNISQMSNQNLLEECLLDSFEPDDCINFPEEIITDLKPVLTKDHKTKKRLFANKRNEKSSLGKKGTMTNPKVEDLKDYPFVCKTCGKGYYLNHYLKVHERTHSEGRSLSCSQCSLKFYCNRSLRLHQVKMHGMSKASRSEAARKSLRGYNKNRRLEWFLCRHCHKKFDCKDLTTQDGKLRVINDDDITETFESFSDFRKHHFNHCQERPTEETHCDICGKDFTSGKMLEDHRTVFHTKEFPFYCEKCGVGKINKSALNKHMLVHTNAKNFHCPICLQSFKRNVQLKFHIMRHNNDLPFMCDLCGKRFTDKQKLKRHHETHSEDKKYPCPQCEKLFVSKSYVYHHIWDTHKKARRPKNSPSVVIKDPPVQEPSLLSSGITTTTTVSFIGLSSSNNMGFQVPTEITFI